MLDPDRDEARRQLVQELSRPEYHRSESVVARVLGWVGDQLSRLLSIVPSIGGLGALLVLLVAVAVLTAAVLAVRGTRRARSLRSSGPGTGPVLDEARLSPEDYRERAGAALRRGDADAALLDALRAITAEADRRALLDAVPALTANEVAETLGTVFGEHHERLRQAALVFDAVRYGDGHADPAQARAAVDLDGALRRARPAVAAP